MTCYLHFRGGGRFANQLYFCLQAYCRSGRFLNCRYVSNGSSDDLLDLFNVGDYFSPKSARHWGLHYQHPFVNYFQKFGHDFSMRQLESFVGDTFLMSKFFSERLSHWQSQIDQDNDLAIHIRNGDYIIPENRDGFAWFDRKAYFRTQLARCNRRFSKIVVVSDDNQTNRECYTEILKFFADAVEFPDGQSVADDFVRLCAYRRKILMNTTFGYWTAFVSNVLYPGSFDSIYAPYELIHGERQSRRVNPSWQLLHV